MKKLLAVLAGTCALALSLPAPAAIITFAVPLDGAQEVNALGDPDGFGAALLVIDDVALTIAWNIVAKNIALPPTGAHIHNAAAGVNGPVRIDFSGQLAGTGLVDTDLAGVLASPADWYVNVHNAVFPAGAIRGQLAAVATPVPEPATLLLFGTGLAGIAAARRRRG